MTPNLTYTYVQQGYYHWAVLGVSEGDERILYVEDGFTGIDAAVDRKDELNGYCNGPG